MTETQLPSTAGAAMAPVRPSAALAFLASSPLIAGEDAAAYDDLSARMSRMLTPSDILEQIWVRDVVDLTWETLRLRRLKAQFSDGDGARGPGAGARSAARREDVRSGRAEMGRP